MKKTITAFGEAKSVGSWAEDRRCVVSKPTLYSRLKKGWDPEEAISKPCGHKLLTAFGEIKSLERWSKDQRCEVSHNTLRKRIAEGYSLEEAIKGKTDLTGASFPDFVVLAKFNNQKWLCRCKFCDRNRKLSTTQILSGDFCRKCRCTPRLLPLETSKRIVYRSMRMKALKRNLDFTISLSDFEKITSSDCTYCGSEPSQRWSKSKQAYAGLYVYNGIDRVNNNIGYLIENCVPCCKQCNASKLDDDLAKFLLRIKNTYKKIFIDHNFGALADKGVQEIVKNLSA